MSQPSGKKKSFKYYFLIKIHFKESKKQNSYLIHLYFMSNTGLKTKWKVSIILDVPTVFVLSVASNNVSVL